MSDIGTSNILELSQKVRVSHLNIKFTFRMPHNLSAIPAVIRHQSPERPGEPDPAAHAGDMGYQIRHCECGLLRAGGVSRRA
ncbi:MAG: hypothetical protein NVSMB49_10100 [Ktedonobacteraceae bacterium]